VEDASARIDAVERHQRTRRLGGGSHYVYGGGAVVALQDQVAAESVIAVCRDPWTARSGSEFGLRR
jgi:hypothetical protein